MIRAKNNFEPNFCSPITYFTLVSVLLRKRRCSIWPISTEPRRRYLNLREVSFLFQTSENFCCSTKGFSAILPNGGCVKDDQPASAISLITAKIKKLSYRQETVQRASFRGVSRPLIDYEFQSSRLTLTSTLTLALTLNLTSIWTQTWIIIIIIVVVVVVA